MVTGSKINSVLILYLVILGLSYISGCRKSPIEDDSEITQKRSIAFCEKILENSRMSEQTKIRAGLVLRKRENNCLDAEPILIHAGLTQPKSKQFFVLVVFMSDEDGDVAGIGIRELRSDPNGRTFVLEEEYPVFGSLVITQACDQLLPVKIRKTGERKNEKDWDNYVNNGVWTREKVPDLWVSIPKEGQIDVEAWVYDHAGHKSAPVQLEYGFPETKTDKPKIRTMGRLKKL